MTPSWDELNTAEIFGTYFGNRVTLLRATAEPQAAAEPEPEPPAAQPEPETDSAKRSARQRGFSQDGHGAGACARRAGGEGRADHACAQPPVLPASGPSAVGAL